MNAIESKDKYNVLFLCTGNSARSILAEAYLNHVGGARFSAYSAGSFPTGQVNSYALELLTAEGLPVADLRSKSWDEFSKPDSPIMDFVFTVCDKAAGEVCPVWPGQPMTAHWGVDDPAAVQGSEETKRHAFMKAYMELARRIQLFLDLPLKDIDAMSLHKHLHAIGRQ